MLDRVADALNIEPAVLTESSTARAAKECVDATEVKAIRSALGRYPSLSTMDSGGGGSSHLKVKRQLEYIGQAWLSSNFTVIAQQLPKLIHEAQLVAESTPVGSNYLSARRSLVMTYRVASSMLLKFEANDIAWLAADRAMQAAMPTDDLIAMARATRSVARAMTSAGQESDAIVALVDMADRMRPQITAADDELAPLFEMLFLAGSIAAARVEDHSTALMMHEEAAAATTRLGPRHRNHYTVFGPANVAAHRVAALTRLHEGGRALDYIATTDPAIMLSLPPERRSNHLLDLTACYTYTGNYEKAVAVLNEAERLAPQEVRCRPLAHGLLRALLSETSGSLSRSLEAMAKRAGVVA